MAEYNGDRRSARFKALERIDDVADRFEVAWRSEHPLPIADFLTPADCDDRIALIRELVKIDFESRCNRGQLSALGAYLIDYPELLEPNGSFPPDFLEHTRRTLDLYLAARFCRGIRLTRADSLADGQLRQVIGRNITYT
jgi:hypothetical protein